MIQLFRLFCVTSVEEFSSLILGLCAELRNSFQCNLSNEGECWVWWCMTMMTMACANRFHNIQIRWTWERGEIQKFLIQYYFLKLSCFFIVALLFAQVSVWWKVSVIRFCLGSCVTLIWSAIFWWFFFRQKPVLMDGSGFVKMLESRMIWWS